MYYQLTESYAVTEDGDRAKVYGVEVFEDSKKENSLPAVYIYCVKDVTFSREEMLEHIALWNELQPTIPQLKYLIEDMIDPPLL